MLSDFCLFSHVNPWHQHEGIWEPRITDFWEIFPTLRPKCPCAWHFPYLVNIQIWGNSSLPFLTKKLWHHQVQLDPGIQIISDIKMYLFSLVLWVSGPTFLCRGFTIRQALEFSHLSPPPLPLLYSSLLSSLTWPAATVSCLVSWPLSLLPTVHSPHDVCMHAQSCPTLCNPMDCSPLGSSVHGISQARTLGWVAISFSRRSSWPKNQIHISCAGRWILYCWATRETQY